MAITALPAPTNLISENEFPKVILVEGSTPSAPAAGEQKAYIDSGDHHLKRIDESSVVTDLEVVQKAVTADPSDAANGDVWFFDDGGTPASLFIRWKKGGTIYSFPLGSAV